LRPCLGTSSAPQRRATFQRALRARTRLPARPIVAALTLALIASCATACGGGTQSGVDSTGEWTLVPPREESVDAAALRRLDRDLLAEPNVRSLLVARNGRLVFERYYHGGRMEQPFDVRSVTKSVVSTLVGIAEDEGKISRLDAPIGELLPWSKQLATDRRTTRVTLRQLLTMTAGLGTPPDVLADPRPVEEIIWRPLANDPGRWFQYDDGGAHIVSAVLSTVTGERTDAFAEDKLFRPLGIQQPRWALDGSGLPYGSAGLFIRARDLAKLGQLYLQEGRWDGHEVVSADWVRQATRRQVAGGAPLEEPYGYFWWVLAEWPRAYAAVGLGGQVVAVFPRQHAVVVITSGVQGQTRIGEILSRVVRALPQS
jgi:CubicO group peptidase (beta-lactamase class C family)